MEANAAPFQQVKSEVQSARGAAGGGGWGGRCHDFRKYLHRQHVPSQLAFVYP